MELKDMSIYQLLKKRWNLLRSKKTAFGTYHEIVFYCCAKEFGGKNHQAHHESLCGGTLEGKQNHTHNRKDSKHLPHSLTVYTAEK